MENIKNLKKEYLRYLKTQGLDKTTIKNYKRYVNNFLSSMKVKRLEDISLRKIKRYKNVLKGRKIKKTTQNYYLIGLRSFLKFIKNKKDKVLNLEEVRLFKHQKETLEVLSKEEIKKLRDLRNQGLREKRNRAIFETLISTRIKVSELCRLDKKIDLDSGILVIKDKNNKERKIHLSKLAVKKIKDYLKQRDDQESALFVSLTKKGRVLGRISPRSVQRLLNRFGRKAGISNITPQTLRDSFAASLFKRTDLGKAKEILGHSDISVTKAYKERLKS